MLTDGTGTPTYSNKVRGERYFISQNIKWSYLFGDCVVLYVEYLKDSTNAHTQLDLIYIFISV